MLECVWQLATSPTKTDALSTRRSHSRLATRLALTVWMESGRAAPHTLRSCPPSPALMLLLRSLNAQLALDTRVLRTTVVVVAYFNSKCVDNYPHCFEAAQFGSMANRKAVVALASHGTQVFASAVASAQNLNELKSCTVVRVFRHGRPPMSTICPISSFYP